MQIKVIFIILFFSALSVVSYACEVMDLTDQMKAQARAELISNKDNPGVRLAITGMKMANSQYGLGSVNMAIQDYEKRFCENAKKKNLNVSVSKSDFKGYYVTCTPMPGCLKEVESLSKEIEGPKFNSGKKLQMSSAVSENYQTGHIRARAQEVYPEIKGSLSQFIDRELKSGIVAAASIDPNYEKNLSAQIDIFRSRGIDAVEPHYRRLITGLDQLLEMPYAGANNIEEELARALKGDGAIPAGRYSMATAITGDDMFVVIKEGEEVKRIVGVDARGLGTANMMARYEKVREYVGAGKSLTDMDDVLRLSDEAIKEADKKMAKSFETFRNDLHRNLSEANPKDFEHRLALAHSDYAHKQAGEEGLMKMRSGSIGDCKGDQSKLLNRITVIHNTLKDLEKMGMDEFFPSTCLGSQYLLMKAKGK